MSKRVMGKASFCNVQDLAGKYSVLTLQETVSEKKLTKQFKKMDVGDVIGIDRRSV